MVAACSPRLLVSDCCITEALKLKPPRLAAGGSLETVITSDGGQAITLATSGAGVVTSFAGSVYTVATGVANTGAPGSSATAPSAGAPSPSPSNGTPSP